LNSLATIIVTVTIDEARKTYAELLAYVKDAEAQAKAA
jgi:hypothetical protein